MGGTPLREREPTQQRRCAYCGYSLAGHVGTHVTCPECGRRDVLVAPWIPRHLIALPFLCPPLFNTLIAHRELRAWLIRRAARWASFLWLIYACLMIAGGFVTVCRFVASPMGTRTHCVNLFTFYIADGELSRQLGPFAFLLSTPTHVDYVTAIRYRLEAPKSDDLPAMLGFTVCTWGTPLVQALLVFGILLAWAQAHRRAGPVSPALQAVTGTLLLLPGYVLAACVELGPTTIGALYTYFYPGPIDTGDSTCRFLADAEYWIGRAALFVSICWGASVLARLLRLGPGYPRPWLGRFLAASLVLIWLAANGFVAHVLGYAAVG